jgi:hypothetical protein
MKLIAHRGLTQGPDTELQNHPDQIRSALHQGFDAEIDLWLVNQTWMLGHDAPQHAVTLHWLQLPGLWIHCKNTAALFALQQQAPEINYFWHENDLLTLTSRGMVWTFLGRPETHSCNSVCVMPEATYSWPEIEHMAQLNTWYGICSDYVQRIRACQG